MAAYNPITTVDLPFFELLNQPPTASSAISCLTTAEDGSDRFIYYLVGSAFYRYDTVADTWQQLANPITAPVTFVSMSYTKRRGYHGRILGATASTVILPGLSQSKLDGQTIRVEFGTGLGQERTLTYVSETVHDSGIITGTSTSTLADSTKKWRVNQWVGYTVGITFGTGATHYKKILYNDATTLTIADVNLQPHEPWNNQVFVAASPYAVPITTAGSQAHYIITSSEYTLNSDWTVTPNSSSYFTTLSGGVYLLSSASGAPFFTLQYYDVLSDTWQTKTVSQSLILAAFGTDGTIERTSKVGTALLSSTATSATARTVTTSSLNLVNDRYANYRLLITGGTGAGQHRRIVTHNATRFTLARDWKVTPDATSTYEIWPDFDRLWAAGNGSSALYAYSPENDYWMQGQAFDDGVTTNVSASISDWMPLGINTGVRIAAGVQAVASAPTAGGTGYLIGDVLTCSVGGTGALVRVTDVAPGGVVTALELCHSGTATGFTTGTGKATTGGTGSGCTINITTVGPTALITFATGHFFRLGDVVTFAGCTEAAWNVAHTVIGVTNATTTICVAITATANMSPTAIQSTTVIVDPTKNWVVNEHVGRLVQLNVAGTTPTTQLRWITANTATTLTVSTAITAAVNGTSKYVIYDSKIFGVDDVRRPFNQHGHGYATGGSTTTLVDSTKAWLPNQWAGYMFKIEAGTGMGSGRISIVSNTATTLTYAAQGFTPDGTTKYEVAGTWGLVTAGSTTSITETTTKNWVVNQWAGKRVRITGGTGVGQEVAITSNTATALTVPTFTAPDTSSTYAILGIPPRGAGIELLFVWGNSDATTRGRYIFSPRGGGTNQIDIYDIAEGIWLYGLHYNPQNELFTTGSSYTYFGGDKIFLSRSVASQPIRVFELDVKLRTLSGKATSSWLQGNITIGNKMGVVVGSGVSFLFLLQDTGTLFSRAALM